MEVEVIIKLKNGVTDPEGEHTKKALELLGFNVNGVRSMKMFEIDLSADEKTARIEVEEMCRKLLANPVIHEYEIRI
jgi:phosphoribosylformylglycinamidine synthase